MSFEGKKVKVLIADDSVVYRSQLRNAAAMLDYVDVVGVAANGRLAVEKLTQTGADLLILDLEMPEMNGLQTLEEIRRRGIQVKVLLFSSHSKRGAEITMDALRAGASDFVTKPGSDGSTVSTLSSDPAKKILELIQPKIEALFPKVVAGSVSAGTMNETNSNLERSARVPTRAVGHVPSPGVATKRYPELIWETVRPQVLVIGSSTGGPNALEKLFSMIRPPYRVPILIAQHMPAVFTATFAERLGKLIGKDVEEVREGRNGEVLLTNRIYVAPGDFHMTLKQDGDLVRIVLDQGPHQNFVRPAVDPLFQSAAGIYRSGCMGVVLTGMGSDGRVGSTFVKDAGGSVLIQNRESCVVYGMPAAVEAAGAFDVNADLDEIARLISQKVSLSSLTDAQMPKQKMAGS